MVAPWLHKLRSQMLIPASKNAPQDAVVVSHQLLVRAGYINQTSAGVFRILPLGQRVISNIEKIIDNELQKQPLGCEKVRLPTISAGKLWEKSGRWNVYGDELFRLKDRKGTDYCLGPTFEEEITDLIHSLGPVPLSNLPLKFYQITSKFRDEMRPRFGLIRAREFLMKDLYTFHSDVNCARQTYDQVCKAYENIFSKLELDFVKVEADSGAIGGNFTHEYQALASIGEDDLVYCDKGTFRANSETIKGYSPGLSCFDPDCSCGGSGSLHSKKGIEVGQAFILGDKYSKSFDAFFNGPDNKNAHLQMGCYGIGVSRVMAAVVEDSNGHDEFGICWPKCIAPYRGIVLTGPGNAAARKEYQKVAEQFMSDIAVQNSNSKKNNSNSHNDDDDDELSFVLDDRWNKAFGSKLAEAKLVGYPYVVVIGKNSIQNGDDFDPSTSNYKVEILDRGDMQKNFELVDSKAAIAKLTL